MPKRAKKLIVFTLLAILLLSMFACGGGGEAPTASLTPTPTIPIRETYLIGEGYLSNWRYVELTTIASWQGSGSAVLPIKITQTPWVVNSSCTVTSSIGHEFEVYVCTGTPHSSYCEFTIEKDAYQPTEGIRVKTVHGTGSYFIQVEASGVEWWVKVGVE